MSDKMATTQEIVKNVFLITEIIFRFIIKILGERE